MKKRLLAFFCMLAVLISGVAFGLTANATAAQERYQVGYAIKDMNPWVDYNDHSKGIQKGLFNLTGNQNDDTRPLEGLFDDNGDGVQGEGDGIYTTATAVTDPYGKTVIYITIDSLQGYSYLTNGARAAIVERLGSDVITEDQIMVCGSHSHSSAAFNSLKGKAGAQGEYFEYVLNQITSAAIEAYNDRAPAEMSKGTVDAKEATAALGYNDGKGYHMNAIRHYQVTMTNKNNTSEKKNYLCWSGDTINLQTEYPFITSGSNKKVVTPVEESDNNLHVLLFRFPDNADKEPVVFVNWRAHTTMNSGVQSKLLSSDYVNGLRTVLADKGYRAAFFQGASGNVVTAAKSAVWSAHPTYKDWLYYVEETIEKDGLKVTSTLRDARKTFVYGSMLAEIAEYCINESGKMKQLPAGRIRNIQLTWHGELQEDNDGLRAAANETKRLEAEGNTIEYPFSFEYEGQTYILNSNYHRNGVYNRSKASSTYTNIELDAILLGNEVAFVSAPDELADKFYVYSEGETFSNDKNDWLNLVDDDSYGTPFVLGYTNGSFGYIANWLDHTKNSQIYTDISGFAEDGEEFFSPGTYESNTSRFAQGQGEALIKQYGKMLNLLKSGYRTSYCEACKAEVEWQPITKEQTGQLRLGTGHYYLYEDLPLGERGTNRFGISNGEVLCLDLNGHKVETPSRSFYIEGKGSTLNLFDSVGTGQAISYSGGNNVGGGAVYASGSTVVNIYGGTIQFIRQENPDIRYCTGNGAVISTSGTINMYGGKLIGGELGMSAYYSSTSTSNGCGGTIYMSGSAKLNASGGQIIAGSTPIEGRGDCVYLASDKCRVTVSGNAQIDEIYMNVNTAKQITIKGSYSGKMAINTKDPVERGSSVATLSSVNIANANLTLSANSEYALVASGNNLLAQNRTSGQAVIYSNYSAVAYDSLSEALQNYDSGLITLLSEVSTDVTVAKDTYIDLNGFNIFGAVAVSEGSTLYCMDSETDDYTVADNIYGRLSSVSGAVAGVPEGSEYSKDGYLMVTEQDGASFHRVNLQLTSMTLRSEDVGLYYKSNFAGDEVVARSVDKFGVALSIEVVPDSSNIEQACCKYTWFENFASGDGGNAGDNTSSLLKGVMKQSNSDFENESNATRPLYGRAYIKLNDGSYMFGAAACRTFRQQLEDANDIWSSLTDEQRAAAVQMCNTYQNTVKKWAVDGILSYGAQNDGVLKIFALGNSYTVDSMHLLYEVYKAENPDKQVILGYAYKSGCILAEHVQYMNSGEPAYTYYEIAADGTRSTTYKVTLSEMLLDENWDIITLQQGSTQSGMVESYNSDITKLYNYAKSLLCYTPVYAWNMTWSYPGRTASNAEGFDLYGSQEAMFEKIVDAVKTVIMTNESITHVMPVGLAVQNARTYYTARKDIHRDAYGHLNDFSRLMAAYVWYCELEGVLLENVKLDAVPAALTKSYTDGDMVLTDIQKQILMQCVNNALAAKRDGTFAVTPVAIAQ